MKRFTSQMAGSRPEVRALLERVPLATTPPLPPEWLRCEMLERAAVLACVPVRAGATVLEVGAGAHALSTVPLALQVGPAGRVVAVERSRWGQFRTITEASGLVSRIRSVAADARRLPLRDDGADLAVCLHGIRSLGAELDVRRVIREMLRVSDRIVLAESLPIATTDAQRAHLAMYDLREEMFLARDGHRDDRRYLPLDRLASLAELAGGVVEKTERLDLDLPHFLAWFPRSLIEGIPDEAQRVDLGRRWDVAEQARLRFGEDQPPVGIVTARRS